MKEFGKSIVLVCLDIKNMFLRCFGFIYFLLKFMFSVLLLILGAGLFEVRGEIRLGYEILLILLFWFIVAITEKLRDNSRLSRKIPIPRNRFTKESKDGEVRVETQRQSEMILYLCDLENYFESNGFSIKEDDERI